MVKKSKDGDKKDKKNIININDYKKTSKPKLSTKNKVIEETPILDNMEDSIEEEYMIILDVDPEIVQDILEDMFPDGTPDDLGTNFNYFIMGIRNDSNVPLDPVNVNIGMLPEEAYIDEDFGEDYEKALAELLEITMKLDTVQQENNLLKLHIEKLEEKLKKRKTQPKRSK